MWRRLLGYRYHKSRVVFQPVSRQIQINWISRKGRSSAAAELGGRQISAIPSHAGELFEGAPGQNFLSFRGSIEMRAI